MFVIIFVLVISIFLLFIFKCKIPCKRTYIASYSTETSNLIDMMLYLNKECNISDDLKLIIMSYITDKNVCFKCVDSLKNIIVPYRHEDSCTRKIYLIQNKCYLFGKGTVEDIILNYIKKRMIKEFHYTLFSSSENNFIISYYNGHPYNDITENILFRIK